MTSRSEYYRNQSKHAQRGIGEKPTPSKRDTNTAWIPEFVSSIQGLQGQFNVQSLIAMQLGATKDERLLRLRELSKMGILHMSSHRENGVFVEYRWELTAEGTL